MNGLKGVKMGEEEGVKVKLLGVWSSPYSRRVELALKLKGVPFEYLEEDLSNKSFLLLEYNPIYRKIPVLVHNGKPIVESLIILEYIEETWKDPPLLPHDPFDKANARFWAKFIDDQLMLSVWKSFCCKEEEREKAKKKACELLKTLESELKGKKFFGGDDVGYLDIVAIIVAFWIQRVQEVVVGVDLLNKEQFPILYKWIERLYHDVSFIHECLPPKEKHLMYIRARYEALATH